MVGKINLGQAEQNCTLRVNKISSIVNQSQKSFMNSIDQLQASKFVSNEEKKRKRTKSLIVVSANAGAKNVFDVFLTWSLDTF